MIHPAWHHIVVVDPQYDNLQSLTFALNKLGYTVTSLPTMEEATSVIVENLVDLVICCDRESDTNNGWCSDLRRMMGEKMRQQETKR